jgi:hypothetical protein
MKTLIAVLAAAFALAGCVAVPAYYPDSYSYGPGSYYGPPAASFSFGYTYNDGPRYGYRHRHWR